MKFRLIVLFSLLLFLCTGCNWVKKNLGLMTSQEIEQLNALITSSNAKKVKNADSVALNLPSDTINALNNSIQQQTAATEPKIKSKAAEDEINTTTSSASSETISKQEVNKQITNKILSEENGYYIICGSFREKANADKLYNKISEIGGIPLKVESKSGLVMVGVGGYATSKEAIQDIDKWVNKGICSHDAWIYDAKKGNKNK